MLIQYFGVTNKEHYGMLWYFLEWSVGRAVAPRGGGGGRGYSEESVYLSVGAYSRKRVICS